MYISRPYYTLHCKVSIKLLYFRAQPELCLTYWTNFQEIQSYDDVPMQQFKGIYITHMKILGLILFLLCLLCHVDRNKSFLWCVKYFTTCSVFQYRRSIFALDYKTVHTFWINNSQTDQFQVSKECYVQSYIVQSKQFGRLQIIHIY